MVEGITGIKRKEEVPSGFLTRKILWIEHRESETSMAYGRYEAATFQFRRCHPT